MSAHEARIILHSIEFFKTEVDHLARFQVELDEHTSFDIDVIVLNEGGHQHIIERAYKQLAIVLKIAKEGADIALKQMGSG